MPKCSYTDLRRTGYLCKHFFTIFNKYSALPWTDLSKSYTESPFLNLNLEIISIASFNIDDKDSRKNEPSATTNSYEQEANNYDNNKNFELVDLPRKRKWRVNKAALLRKTLKEIKDVSILVDDEDEALERLDGLKLLFKKSLPTETDIPLEQQEVMCH